MKKPLNGLGRWLFMIVCIILYAYMKYSGISGTGIVILFMVLAYLE